MLFLSGLSPAFIILTLVQTWNIYGAPHDNITMAYRLNFSNNAISLSNDSTKEFDLYTALDPENTSLSQLAQPTKLHPHKNMNNTESYVAPDSHTEYFQPDIDLNETELEKVDSQQNERLQMNGVDGETTSEFLAMINTADIGGSVSAINITKLDKNQVTTEKTNVTNDTGSNTYTTKNSEKLEKENVFSSHNSSDIEPEQTDSLFTGNTTSIVIDDKYDFIGDNYIKNGSQLLDSITTAKKRQEIALNATESEVIKNEYQELEEYYRRTHRCLQEETNGIWWNTTRSGQISIKKCMQGYIGKAYRMCYHSGRWGQVDRLECQIELLSKVRKLVIKHFEDGTTDGIIHLASDMLRVLQSYPILSISDILEGMESINDVLMSRTVSNGISSHHAPRCSQYLETILKIADIFVRSIKEKINDDSVQQILAVKMVIFTKIINRFNIYMTQSDPKIKMKTTYVTDNKMTFGSKVSVWLGADNFKRSNYWIKNDVLSISQECSASIGTKRAVQSISWFGEEWASQLNDQMYAVNSPIVSVTASINGSEILQMKNKITLVLFKAEVGAGYALKCGYLRNASSSNLFTYREISIWETKRCVTEMANKSAMICICDSRTPVAVLIVEEDDKNMVRTHEIANIVYLGCLFSMATVILTFISHISVGRTRVPGSIMIMLNVVVSILATQVIFMAGVLATRRQDVCEIIAILLHYCYLVTSFWLFSFTINMYMVRKTPQRMEKNEVSRNCDEAETLEGPGYVSNSRKYVRYYCILSWAVPVVIIILSYMFNSAGYETKRYCWLSIKKGMLISYIAPIGILIVFNTAIVLLVMKTYLEMRSIWPKSYIDIYRRSLKGAVMLLPAVAINWFIGVLSLEDSTFIFDYVFSVTNSIEGLMIYMFFSSNDTSSKCNIFTKLKQCCSCLVNKKPKRDRITNGKSAFDREEFLHRNDSQPLLDISAPSVSTLTSPDACLSSSTISELCT